MSRRFSREVRVGSLSIGGGAPVSVQSMTNTDTGDVVSTVAQIRELTAAGCELARAAVPSVKTARLLGEIKNSISIPLAADVHFDYRIALEALRQGVDKLRLNPGNIRDAEKIKLIADEAGSRGVPIRIGVNSGSLDRERYGPPTAQALVNSALDEAALLESRGFKDVVISVKSFDVPTTVEAYRAVAAQTDCPLHLGITEAGPPRQGIVRSAVGIGTLLAEGVGDTIRVSLTGPPVLEVKVGFEVLKSLNLREQGFTIISCPTCGRTPDGFLELVEKVEERLSGLGDLPPMKVAVMGCVVNGPGEAGDADVGVACSPDGGMIFSGGREIGKFPRERIVDELIEVVLGIGKPL